MKKHLVQIYLFFGIISISLSQNFESFEVGAEIIGPAGICGADINCDGFLDVVAAAWDGNAIELYKSNGLWPLNWEQENVTEDFGGASYVVVGDIDLDGMPDIIASAFHDNELAWFKCENETWMKYPVTSEFLQAHEVTICDVDLDGDLDILGAAAESNEISWFENTGVYDEEWPKHLVDDNSMGARSVDAADIDNDGDIDILGTSQGSGKVAQWINKDNNTMNWNYEVVETFSGAWPLDPGDFDNDGDIDFVVGGFNLNQVRWYENDYITDEIVTDYDGNEYQTVEIGDQIWLKQNIKSLHYSDGTEITEVWSYDDNEDNAEIYGRLYTWDGAMNYSTSEGAQGVCPIGWHVPTDDEWTTLGNYLGGDAVAGGKMKQSGINYWQSPNTGATNQSGFSGLPSGEYDYNHYQYLGMYMVMWSSTETNSNWCKYRALSYNDAELHTNNFFKNFRYSVRCIKNQSVGLEEQINDHKQLKISPNPVKNILKIEFENDINSIEILNMSGESVQHWSSINRQIDISSLSPGIYILKLISQEGVFKKKFVKI